MIRIVRWFFGILGVVAFLMLVLSFTNIPFYAWYRLGTSQTKLDRPPKVIVILSGNSMPSPDGLIRAWYGAEAARRYPQSQVIIALPYGEGDSLKPLRIMAEELTTKGVDPGRILYEPHGFNTRTQALNVAALLPHGQKDVPLMLITAPEHMYRSVKAFRKVGFTNVGGAPAFDVPIDPDRVSDHSKPGKFRVKSLDLRYNMWSYLHYELLVLREYSAIAYYRLKGWI
jgi:uncharacterized SAM-binding protein YcdF (DUF218 family)